MQTMQTFSLHWLFYYCKLISFHHIGLAGYAYKPGLNSVGVLLREDSATCLWTSISMEDSEIRTIFIKHEYVKLSWEKKRDTAKKQDDLKLGDNNKDHKKMSGSHPQGSPFCL